MFRFALLMGVLLTACALISAQDLQGAPSGTELVLRDPDPMARGVTFQLRGDPTGTIILQDCGSERSERGTWRVAGDTLCVTSPAGAMIFSDGAEECTPVTVGQDTLTLNESGRVVTFALATL